MGRPHVGRARVPHLTHPDPRPTHTPPCQCPPTHTCPPNITDLSVPLSQAGCEAHRGRLPFQGCQLLAPEGANATVGLPEVVAQGLSVMITAGFPIRLPAQLPTYPSFTGTPGLGVAGLSIQCAATVIPGSCVVANAVLAMALCTSMPDCRSVTVFTTGGGRPQRTGQVPTPGSQHAYSMQAVPAQNVWSPAVLQCPGVDGYPGPVAFLSSETMSPDNSFWAPTVYSLSRISGSSAVGGAYAWLASGPWPAQCIPEALPQGCNVQHSTGACHCAAPLPAGNKPCWRATTHLTGMAALATTTPWACRPRTS